MTKEEIIEKLKKLRRLADDGVKRDKKANGCLLDGQVYQAWPKCWEKQIQTSKQS